MHDLSCSIYLLIILANLRHTRIAHIQNCFNLTLNIENIELRYKTTDIQLIHENCTKCTILSKKEINNSYSNRFVMELLSNEYHLVGPVVSPTKKWYGCTLDCEGHTIDDALRRRKIIDDERNDVCGCTRFPRRSLRKDPRSPTTPIVERPEEPIFHSTRISADERDNDADRRDREFNADVSDLGDDRRRDTIGMERDDYAELIPGPSRRFLETPARKKVRVEDRGVRRADEEDDETTTEEDVDCTCDAEVTRDEHSRTRPLDRSRVRNGRRRNDEEEERMEREDEEDEEGERMAEEDEDAEEDSAYEELRARAPRRRTTARERELKRWIRRCRRECERRRGR